MRAILPRGEGLECRDLELIYPDSAQTIAIGNSSTQGATIQSSVVMLFADVDCYMQFGTAPTATSSSPFLPSNILIAWAFKPGERIAVKNTDGSSVGSLHVIIAGAI